MDTYKVFAPHSKATTNEIEAKEGGVARRQAGAPPGFLRVKPRAQRGRRAKISWWLVWCL